VAGIDVNAVLPQLSEERAGAFAGGETGQQLRPLSSGDVDGAGVLLDHLEPLGHLLEGEHVPGVLHQGQDAMLVLGLRPLEVQQFVEVAGDGFGAVGALGAVQGVTPGIDVLPDELVGLLLPLEDGNDALLRRAPALPVAAARCLEDGIQPRLLPVDGGEVQVHPGLHQGGGRYPAGEALFKPLADFGQHPPPVGGGHQGGEAVPSLLRQQPEQLHRPCPAVEDGEGGGVGLHQAGQLRRCQLPRGAEGGSPEGLREGLDIGAELPHRQAGEELLQGGLGGGAEYSGDAVALHQAADGPQAGEEVGEGEHLGLVKDDDAFGQAVQLAAPGGAVGKE